MSLLWKLGGVAIGLVAAWLLVTMYGNQRYGRGQSDERAAWAAKATEAADARLAGFQVGLARVQAAETRYVETIRTLPPVTNTIVERSTAYAATPAGAAVCLGADRVLWLDQARSSLFPAPAAPAAGGSAGTVPPDASSP